MAKGRFITFEGGEGAGKSTQVKLLGDYLRTQGIEVLQTREVGGCPSAESIREVWLEKGEGYWDAVTEVFLISAARREHLTKVIWPSLEKGVWVLSDRYADSTRAYQGVGLGLGVDFVDQLYQRAAGEFLPDLTLLLDLPVDQGMARVAARRGPDDRYQQKDMSFHQKLRDAYLKLAAESAARIKIVDAQSDPKKVALGIQQIVQQKFSMGG